MYFETTQMVNRGTKECTTADVAVEKNMCKMGCSGQVHTMEQ